MTMSQQESALVDATWIHVLRVLKAEKLDLRDLNLDANQRPVLFRDLVADGEPVLQKLLDGQSMFVTDDELRKVFTLRSVDRDSVPGAYESIFYVRSYPVSVGQLKKIVRDWEDEGLNYTEMQVWMDAVNEKDEEDAVCIRYIGTANGGKTGYDRFSEDLWQRKSGVLKEFQDKILQEPIVDWHRVYEFVNLCYD